MPHYAVNRKAKRLVPLLEAWFADHARKLPWRRTRDPYAIWVSEIMLQQTQVATVVPYWERWMAALPTIEKLARGKPARVLKLWEGLGYYSRARNLQAAARQIVREHDGFFPEDHAAILALPGIGRYTAGAIGSIAFGQPQPIVDGNIVRVLTRLFGIEENSAAREVRERLWSLAETMVRAADDCSALNQSLMELGATVCHPRQPNCCACPVARSCVARRENSVDRIPAKSKPAPTQLKNIDVFILTDGARYLVQKRPAGGVNAGYWEFPNTDSGDSFPVPAGQQPVALARHSIMNWRLELRAFFITSATANGEWRSLEEIRALPFTAAHRKLLPALSAASRKAA